MEAKPWPVAVKEARLRKGLKPAELARRIGVDPKTIGRWEKGEVGMPQGSSLRRVLYVLYVLGLQIETLARPASEVELAEQWISLSEGEREALDIQQAAAAVRVRGRGRSTQRTQRPSEDGDPESPQARPVTADRRRSAGQ